MANPNIPNNPTDMDIAALDAGEPPPTEPPKRGRPGDRGRIVDPPKDVKRGAAEEGAGKILLGGRTPEGEKDQNLLKRSLAGRATARCPQGPADRRLDHGACV